jgi:signal recognition particle subunit SRP19
MAPTLEEVDDVEDIDNMDFDPADFDPKNPFSKDNPVAGGAGAMLNPTAPKPATSSSAQPQPQTSGMPQGGPFLNSDADMTEFGDWQVVYPVYFDASKTHSEGRRVSKDMAVKNPQAHMLMLACREIGVHVVYEAEKTHPKDWANPGRVRVLLKDGSKSGLPANTVVKNKRHLFRLLSDYLKKHPTTENTPKESPMYTKLSQMSGAQLPDSFHPLAVPRGWKINDVLPLNSRALSSGEQSEEMFNQMQKMFPGMNMPDPPKQKKIKVRQR